MGNSALKSKLIQQLTAMRETVFYEIFLDLQKVYDALDWEKCLKSLVSYGLCTRALQILQMYWIRLAVVVRDGGKYPPSPSMDTAVLPRDTPCHPQSLTWLWMPSSATG